MCVCVCVYVCVCLCVGGVYKKKDRSTQLLTTQLKKLPDELLNERCTRPSVFAGLFTQCYQCYQHNNEHFTFKYHICKRSDICLFDYPLIVLLQVPEEVVWLSRLPGSIFFSYYDLLVTDILSLWSLHVCLTSWERSLFFCDLSWSFYYCFFWLLKFSLESRPLNRSWSSLRCVLWYYAI